MKLVVQGPTETPILLRGQSQRLSLQVLSTQDLPADARLRAPVTVELRDKGLSGNARIVELLATERTPDRFTLMLVTGQGREMQTLAELELQVEDAPPPGPTRLAEELSFAPNEALGMALSPYVLSLFNDRREGSGAWSAISYSGEPSKNTGYWRTTFGAEASFEERVRLGVSTAVDVWERGPVATGRGNLDIYSWINVRVIKRSDLSLDTELAAWFPTTSNPSSIDRVRLAPSLTVSLDLDDRLLLRTRQGAILNMGSGGPFLWASAYGIDLRLVRLLALAIEVDLIVGKLGNAVVSDGGGGGGLSVLLGPASLYTMVRYGFAGDFQNLAGKLTFSFGLRLSFP